MTNTPRPEYPRPILKREHWQNLNGKWSFQPDPTDVGLDNKWWQDPEFKEFIIVPFPIESEASGQHNLNPAKVNWYQREFDLPTTWTQNTMLHIGACDHWTRVFVNGQEVGQHRGGYTSIDIDVSHTLQVGTNSIVIRVEDSDSWTQPRGKQAGTTKWPIDYDTVTGIWQTVWLEPVSKTHINAVHSHFQKNSSTLTVVVETNKQNDYQLKVELCDQNKLICDATKVYGERSESKVQLQIDNAELWSPQSPKLYQLQLSLFTKDGSLVDTIESYVGLRQVSQNGQSITINGEPIYIRGVLDQGYFEQGWYTPVDDETIKKDVELTLSLGFNCARKHQKIEDPRYLYWADRLGLLVWEEMPSGRVFTNELVRTLTDEWMSVIKRDRQHPSVIAWVPFNESWGIWNQIDRPEQRAFADGIVGLTRAMDQSRLVIGNDGWEYSSGDLWTLHIYEGESQSIEDRLQKLMQDPSSNISGDDAAVGQKVGALNGASIKDLPILLTECGGMGYTPTDLEGDEFAYGELPKSPEELLQRFESVAETIDNATQLSGYVWTQLTDIQQEINGVLYFDRTPKLPIDQIRKVMLSIGED